MSRSIRKSASAGLPRIRIAAPIEPAFAPVQIALANGLFQAEQVAVENVAVPPGVAALDLLLHGDADIVMGSLWFAASRPDRPIVCLGQINARCHHVLVGRPDVDPLLVGPRVRVLVPGHAPTPAVALYETVAKARPEWRLTAVPLPNSRAVEAEFFDYGVGDLALVPLDRAVTRNAQVVLDIPELLGPVPWSVLFGRTESTTILAEGWTRVRRGLADAVRWLETATKDDITETLRSSPGGGSTVEAVMEFVRIGLWPPSLTLDRTAAARWYCALARYGAIPDLVSVDSLEVVEQ
jgi:hypothetical protein